MCIPLKRRSRKVAAQTFPMQKAKPDSKNKKLKKKLSKKNKEGLEPSEVALPKKQFNNKKHQAFKISERRL